MKRTKLLLASLESQGCKLRRTTNGWWIGFPNGKSGTFHLSPSDRRAEANFRAIVRRNGVVWPFDS